MLTLIATYGALDGARDIGCLAVGFAAGQLWCVLRNRRRQ